jgi:hypothetical protein
VSKRPNIPNLIRQFDESLPTVSALAPLACFAVAYTILILLRLVTIFAALNAKCVETDEFWYSSSGGNWPLVGSFFLVLFLLLVWNILIAFDSWKASKGSKVMIVANSIGIVAMIYIFAAVHEAATLAQNSRTGLYTSFKMRPSILPWVGAEDECVTMRRFSGRWKIIDRQIGYYGINIPGQWIELKPWGYAYAQDASWSQPYAVRWRPPYKSGFPDDKLWHEGILFDAPWDFDLQGDTLTLTLPDKWFALEWQKSTITLRREPLPDKPVFANPHAIRRN